MQQCRRKGPRERERFAIGTFTLRLNIGKVQRCPKVNDAIDAGLRRHAPKALTQPDRSRTFVSSPAHAQGSRLICSARERIGDAAVSCITWYFARREWRI